ncbi:uncharacterized protein [Pleurodeles waltl]|uniref:uncharacterized protein n=1 Tax=Pleurodeles waltl TaxID=8319 RepID=UPI00370965CF
MQTFRPDPLSHPFGPYQTAMQIELMSDLEAFLSAFERVAVESLWPRKDWPRHLAPLFSGHLRAMVQTLPPHISEDYDEFKDAILEHVGVSEDRYRKEFRSLTFTAGERPQAVAHKLSTLGRKWLKPGVRSPDEIVELIIVEQFIQILPDGAGEWLSHRPVSSLEATVQLLEEYFMREAVRCGEDNSNVRISAQKPEPLPEGVTTLEFRNVLRMNSSEESSDQSLVTLEGRERLESLTARSVAAVPEEIQMGANQEETLVGRVGMTESAVARFIIVNSEVIPLNEQGVESCLMDQPEHSRIESCENSKVCVVIVEPEKGESNDESKTMSNILAPEKKSRIDEGEDCFIVNHEHEMRMELSEVVCVSVEPDDRPITAEGEDCFIVNHHGYERGANTEHLEAVNVNLESETRSMTAGGAACIIECQRSESTRNAEEVCVTVEPEVISKIDDSGDCIIMTCSSQEMRTSTQPSKALCATVNLEDRLSDEGVECIIMTHSEKGKRESIESYKSLCATEEPEDGSKEDEGVDSTIIHHSEQDKSEGMESLKTMCVPVEPGDGPTSKRGVVCSIIKHSEQVKGEGREESKVRRVTVGPQDWSKTEDVQDCFIINHQECEEKMEDSKERRVTMKCKHVEQEQLYAMNRLQSEGQANLESSKAELSTLKPEGAKMVKDSKDCIIMQQPEPGRENSNNTSKKIDPERLVVVESEKYCARGHPMTSRSESFKAGVKAVKSEGRKRNGNRKETSGADLSDPGSREITRNSVEGRVTSKQQRLSMTVEWEKYSDMQPSEHEIEDNPENCKAGFLTVNPESPSEVMDWKASREHKTEPGRREESAVQFLGIKPEGQSEIDGCPVTSAIGHADRQEGTGIHKGGPVTVKSEHNRRIEGVEFSCKVDNPEPERKEVSVTMKQECLTKNEETERQHGIGHSEVESSVNIKNSTAVVLKVKAESGQTNSDWEKSFFISPLKPEIKDTFQNCGAGFVAVKSEHTRGDGPERTDSTAKLKEGIVTVEPEGRPMVNELGNAWIMGNENTESCQVKFGTVKPEKMSTIELRERTSSKSPNDPTRITSAENFKTGVATVNCKSIAGIEKYEDIKRTDNLAPDMRMNIKKGGVEFMNKRSQDRSISEDLNTENRKADLVTEKSEALSKTEGWVRPYIKDYLRSESRAGIDNHSLESVTVVPESMSKAGARVSSSTQDARDSNMQEGIEQYVHVAPQALEDNTFSNAGSALHKTQASLPYGVHLPSDIAHHSSPGEIHPQFESQTEKQCFVVVNNEIIPVIERVREDYGGDVPYSERMQSNTCSSSEEQDVFTTAASAQYCIPGDDCDQWIHRDDHCIQND